MIYQIDGMSLGIETLIEQPPGVRYLLGKNILAGKAREADKIDIGFAPVGAAVCF